MQRAEKEGEAPCVHLVVGKTREKKFFERRCRFRCCASQPTNQPATFYQQFLLPASPAFSILLCPAALIEAWKEGENRRAFSSVPMELNLTCIRTSGRNLRATTSYNASLLFSSFLPRRKFFALSDSRVRESDFKVSLVQFETFSLSLSLPPFLSFLHLNSILPIHRIEENLSNSPFRESVASRRGAIFLFDRAKPGFLFLFFFFVQRSEHIHAISRYKVETCYGYWRRGR